MGKMIFFLTVCQLGKLEVIYTAQMCHELALLEFTRMTELTSLCFYGYIDFYYVVWLL